MASTDPNAIQLYYYETPNAYKITTFLEDAGIPYTVHFTDIVNGGAQFTPEFTKISPNNKVPAIVDPQGPNGKPISVFESGAILQYLSEKTGKFVPKDATDRVHVNEWLHWQMSGLGPTISQLSHFNRSAPEKIPYAIERYLKETKRLFKVLDTQLEGHDWVVGNEISIADYAIAPWLHVFQTRNTTISFPTEYPNLDAYVKRFDARPGVQRGFKPEIPAKV